jgi:hypothetical protein
MKDLHNKLTALARQMDYHPAEPAMREHFLQALDQQIHIELRKKGFTALSKMLEELVAEAIEVEQSLAYVDSIEGQVKELPSSSKYSKCTYTTSYLNKPKKPKNEQARPLEKKVYIQEKPTGSTLKSTLSTSKQQASKPQKETSTKGDPSSSTCNKCGKPGHWAKECPMRTVSAKSVNIFTAEMQYNDTDVKHQELDSPEHVRQTVQHSSEEELEKDVLSEEFMVRNEYKSNSSDAGPVVIHTGFVNISTTEVDISAFAVEPLYNLKVL